MGARPAASAGQHRSLGDLLGEISDGSAQLVRDEIRLARAEGVESLLALKHGGMLLATGLVLGLFAAGAIITSAVLALSQYLLDGRTWLAALVVAVLLGAIAWFIAQRGVDGLSGAKLAPRETAQSLKETAAWLKHPTKSAVR